MPKIPVMGANLSPERRKVYQFERYLAEIVRPISVKPLRPHDLETAARAYAVAVEKGGDEFLEFCKELPSTVRAMVAEVAQFAAKGEKPRR